MKKFFLIILTTLVLYLIYHFRLTNTFMIFIQRNQAKIISSFMKVMREGFSLYILPLLFLYGMLHSAGPGHGKTFLIMYSLEKSRKSSILAAAFIAYMQGFMAFLVVYLLTLSGERSKLNLRTLDRKTLIFYSLILIFLGLYGLLSEFLKKEKKSKFLLVSAFIPCTGVMSILLVASILGYGISILGIAFFISSGVFTTLLLIILLGKALYSDKFLTLNKAFSLILFSLMIILGSYKLYGYLA